MTGDPHAPPLRGSLRPTLAGGCLLVLVLVLLLMAINEANNLLYALAFVLLSVWMVSAVQAWFNLRAVQVRALAAPSVAAGEAGVLTLQLEPQGRDHRALAMVIGSDDGQWGDTGCTVDLHSDQPLIVQLPWRARRRGWQTLAAVELRSAYPLGLVQARRRLPVSIRRLVWPQPAPHDHAPPAHSAAQRAEQADQFTGLSPWRAGDSPRRLAWKAMARAGAPMVKRFDGADGQRALSIDWHDTEGDTEQRLAVLARRVLDAEHQLWPWQLVMPGHPALPQGPGSVAQHRALAALALHALPGSHDEH